jgi:hypothetical protein
MKKLLTIAFFSAFTFGTSTVVSAQESYAGALNVFATLGNNSSVSANYEFALAKNFTISPEATIPFDLDYISAGARVDYYFDSLLNLVEPWDVWAGAGVGFNIGSDSNNDDLNLNLHIGGEYKFNQTWGLILEGGNGGGSLGVGIHL